MDDGEAAHGAGAEQQQGDAGNQRGDVGIDDGVPGVFVAFGDGRLRLHAVAQLFAYPFVNQYVGVDGHAEGQCHCGDAGQGEGGVQEGEGGH